MFKWFERKDNLQETEREREKKREIIKLEILAHEHEWQVRQECTNKSIWQSDISIYHILYLAAVIGTRSILGSLHLRNSVRFPVSATESQFLGFKKCLFCFIISFSPTGHWNILLNLWLRHRPLRLLPFLPNSHFQPATSVYQLLKPAVSFSAQMWWLASWNEFGRVPFSTLGGVRKELSLILY